MSDPLSPLPPPPAPVPLPQPAAPRPSRAPLLLLFGCFGLVGLAFLGLLVAAAVGSHTSVSEESVLKITLAGEIPEHVQQTGLEDLFGGSPVTVRQHVLNLKKAAVDAHLKGVVVRLEPLAVGWAKVEELRDALTDFKKSGKFLIVYSEYMGEKEYALALAADTIVMPKDAPFEFNGLATEVSHYPGLLEKLGIEVQYFRFGKYKSVSGESYGRKASTEPVKEMINATLDGVFAHFVDAVAARRQLPKEQVLALLDDSHWKSDWALDQKLIDRLAYWDELEAELKEKTHKQADQPVSFISAAKYRSVDPERAGLPEGKHTFALIYSQGLIVAGKGGGDNQGSAPIIKQLREAVEDKDVEAIIFRVDSPGGAGLGCDYVRREVERARAKKPVVVSMSDVAASGGYWVSMDASAIVAQPTTYTGSIGIFSVVPSLAGTYDKLALNNEVYKRGAHADALIGARRFTDEEAKRFDQDLHSSYLRFVELAAKGRGKTPEEMEVVAQGRTWLGDQAKERGLVDRLGGFDVAIEVAKEKAKIAAADPVRLKSFEKEKDLFAFLRHEDDDDESPDLSAALLGQLVKASGLAPLLGRLPGMSAFARQVLTGHERLYPLMEYQVDVR